MRYKLLLLPLVVILGLVLCSTFLAPKSFGEGVYANLGTSDAGNGSNDAINFSQGRVWTIDKFGKYIWITQTLSSTNSHWAWSNDLGSTWTQGSESYIALTRGSVAYDSIHDKLHVIWAGQAASDGIIYRRYAITRDGSNNITAITRDDASINLQLDISNSGQTLEQPVALWVNDGTTNGSLIAIWSKYGSGINEIRGSMRTLSLSTADGVAGNWKALDNAGDTFSIDPAQVAADKIYSSNTGNAGASASVRGGSGSRKDDMYVFVSVAQGAVSNVYAYRAIWNSANKDWRGGWQSPVTIGSVNAQAGGYSVKQQLITKPVLDSANDRLYVGWARWKDVSAGDTVSFAYLNSTDTVSSTVDFYSANGTHSYAPTLDIAFDSTQGLLYASYIESTTNGDNGSIDYKTYDGTTLSSATRFYTSPGGTGGQSGSADIPIMYENRTSNNRLVYGFRVNGALPPNGGNPHKIYWGYIALPTPTPTSTPTPTPTNTPTPTLAPTAIPTTVSPTPVPHQDTNTSKNTSTPNTCSASKPLSTPDLFQIDGRSVNATLYFAPVNEEVTSYFIAYGYTPGEQRFATSLPIGKVSGALSYTINELSPNTTYYIHLKAVNNCTSGNWSNEMKITTTRAGSIKGTRYYKNLLAQLVSIFPRQTTSLDQKRASQLTNTMCRNYVVKKGDYLIRIASIELGDYRLYTNIMRQNALKSSVLEPGQVLKLNCN